MRNEQRRAAAQRAGKATYQHEVVDYWPGCAECGEPIRRNVDAGPGLWRECGCAGVLWTCRLDGWERVEPG